MRKFVLGALAALVLLATPAFALASAGTAKGVDPAADAVFNDQTRILTVGADINVGDLIRTGPKGQVEILFSDDTKLVVGPNSNLMIEDYLIRNNGSAGKFAVDMLAGTFRFVTGTSPKSAYTINTPTGTIGVRGTAYDVYVDEDGIAHIIEYEGTSVFCDAHKKLCKELEDLCQVGEISTDDTAILGNTTELTGEQRQLMKTYFLYARDESSLDPEFRIPHAFECLHAPPNVSVPQPPAATHGSDCKYHDEGGGCYDGESY